MHRAFERADLMVILDGIDGAVVKLDEHANFAAMKSGRSRYLSAIRTELQRYEREIYLGNIPRLERHPRRAGTMVGYRTPHAGQFRVLLPERSALV